LFDPSVSTLQVAELSTNLASKQQHLQGFETHALHRQEHQNTIQAMLEGSAMNEQITKLEAQVRLLRVR
jgi:hypothetical protein